MSAINLILDAILADIPPNIQQDMGDEIWDAHHNFQVALLEALSGHPDAQAMIDRYREEPDVYGSVIAEALVDSGVDENAAVTEAAGEVLALVDPLDADTESEEILNIPGTYGAGDASIDDL